MDIGEIAGKVLPKVNWPAAAVIVAALALYGFVLAPEHVTKDDLREHTKELKKAIQDQSTTDAVHDVSIESLHGANERQDSDIRELRRNP